MFSLMRLDLKSMYLILMVLVMTAVTIAQVAYMTVLEFVMAML